MFVCVYLSICRLPRQGRQCEIKRRPDKYGHKSWREKCKYLKKSMCSNFLIIYWYVSLTLNFLYQKNISCNAWNCNSFSVWVILHISLFNTSLAAPGALANRLQRRTARKANEANSEFPNLKTKITSLHYMGILINFC